jgi:hypothetical protein
MISISLKIDEKTLLEVETILKGKGKSRNSYFNEAIVFYNQTKKRELLSEQIANESKMVKASSSEVLKEFEGLENDYEY